MKAYQSDSVKNLPDKYRKDSNSNNFKILEIEKYEREQGQKEINEIRQILNINNAKGASLDIYGIRVKQERGSLTDAQYLTIIKAKIMANMSNGTHPSILQAICTIMDCEPADIYIVDSETPCVVEASNLPLIGVVRSGYKPSQIVEILQNILPAGVKLKAYSFTGTFEFAGGEYELNAEKGFSEDENGLIGGFLGIASIEEEDAILPI